ncbi:nucleic acid-binding, OB-fold protein, partial [Tanacetum coccineum]
GNAIQANMGIHDIPYFSSHLQDGSAYRIFGFVCIPTSNFQQTLETETTLSGDVVELMLWDEMARELNKEQFELMEKCRKVSKYGAINTAIDWYYESCSNCIRKVTDGNGVRQFVDHRPQPYNYKAFISDGSSTALFTFFTPNANVLTGSDCTQLIKVHNTPGPREFPTDILNPRGENTFSNSITTHHGLEKADISLSRDLLGFLNLLRIELGG